MMFQGCTRCVWNCMNILLLFSAWKRAHSNHDRSQWNQKLNYHCNRPESLSSWWFQPVWKICSKNRIISPGFRVKIKISELPPPSHILNLNWVGKSGWERPHEEFFQINIGSFLLNNPTGRSIFKGNHNSTRWKVRVSRGEQRNHEIQKKGVQM